MTALEDMPDYPSNHTIEDETDLAELADRTLIDGDRIGYEDIQADNNNRAGRAAVALSAYLENFDRGEPLETVMKDLVGDLRHLCDSLVDEDGERGVDWDAINWMGGNHYEAELKGVI